MMKMKKLAMTLRIGMSALIVGSAYADTATAPASTSPTLDQLLTASGITEQGYIEAAYTHYDLANPSTLNYFDNNPNTFALKQAALQLSKLPAEGVGGLVNITTGSDADYIKSYPYATGSASNSFDLTQGFLQYAHGIYSVMAGKFVTLAGAETINSTTNYNVSHSIAFLNAIPFTHTGVRMTVAPSPTFSVILGEDNGWDQQQAKVKAKTTELGFAFNPTTLVSWTGAGYWGQNLPTAPLGTVMPSKAINAGPGLLDLVDSVITVKPTTALSLVLNADDATQKHAFADGSDASWSAIDFYANYVFTPIWQGTVRLESFDDKNGYKLGYGVGNTRSATLTVGYSVTPALLVRAEAREDKAPMAAFNKGSSLTDTEQYYALDALYKF